MGWLRLWPHPGAASLVTMHPRFCLLLLALFSDLHLFLAGPGSQGFCCLEILEEGHVQLPAAPTGSLAWALLCPSLSQLLGLEG